MKNIKKLINNARKNVVTYVNTTMLFTYWNIGKMIVEEQGGDSKAKYGNNLNIDYVIVNPTAGAHCGPDCVGIAFHAKHR